MRTFKHQFEPNAQDPCGAIASLSVREIEDAGLQEVLQAPGAALGSWAILENLLEPGIAEFHFREPLGKSREVKTALSALFGRFVARAYATRHLGYTHFLHIYSDNMQFNAGVAAGLQRTNPGDLPDWVTWKVPNDIAILEAKGCHDHRGPAAAIGRAWRQAHRVDVHIAGRPAPLKRYAIATRWGSAARPLREAIIRVLDPVEPDRYATEAELRSTGLGIARLHAASLLRPLGLPELASSLEQIASAISKRDEVEAIKTAKQKLDQASTRKVRPSAMLDRAPDDLVGGFVLRSGMIIASERVSVLDQNTLLKLDLRPTFIGMERRFLETIISGEADTLRQMADEIIAVRPSRDSTVGPTSDNTGTWTIRLEEDQSEII